MRRATTPTLELVVGADLADCDFRVALAQGTGIRIVKTREECATEALADGTTSIIVRLTQQETLSLTHRAPLRVQVRFSSGGEVAATDIAEVGVGEVLDEEVMA